MAIPSHHCRGLMESSGHAVHGSPMNCHLEGFSRCRLSTAFDSCVVARCASLVGEPVPVGWIGSPCREGQEVSFIVKGERDQIRSRERFNLWREFSRLGLVKRDPFLS